MRQNDELTIMVTGAAYLEWDVLNRWGNKLYSGSQAEPAEQLKLWSPAHDELSQGPYMILIRAVGLDGQSKTFSGTVMVK